MSSANLLTPPFSIGPRMLLSNSLTEGIRFPKFTAPVFPTSTKRFNAKTGVFLFRDPNILLPFLAEKRDYIVYYITAHGTQLTESFNPPQVGFPYSVIQTGARESTGCSFCFGGNMLLKNLFSKNLSYTFQYLLGLHNDDIPRVFADIHYATNDYFQSDTGVKEVETIPNKSFSFNKKDEDRYGVYVYDPNSLGFGSSSFRFGTPEFILRKEFAPYFTRSGGITLEELISIIPAVTGINNCPAIFVFYSCTNFKEGTNYTTCNVNRTVKLLGSESFYSLVESIESDYILPIGSLPEIALPSSRFEAPIPENYRLVKSPTVNYYYWGPKEEKTKNYLNIITKSNRSNKTVKNTRSTNKKGTMRNRK